VIDKTTPRDDQRSRRKGTFRQKLYLVLFGLLFGLLLCEILLRVIGYSYPMFYASDYYRGFALRPGIEGHYQREGGSYVRINSDGQRDREHTKTKPPDTVRIVVLGDSFAEAMHVPMEQTFWSLLERKLEECHSFAGKHVEVLNFGVSGYGTAQELVTLRQKVWDYSPDIVVLAFTTYKRDGMQPGFWEGMQHASLENMPQPLKDAYLEANPDSKGLQVMFDRDVARMLAFKDISDADLQVIQAPSLVINGDAEVVRAEHALALSHALPHAQLAILPGGHGEYIGEICAADKHSRVPALVTAMIAAFLKG